VCDDADVQVAGGMIYNIVYYRLSLSLSSVVCRRGGQEEQEKREGGDGEKLQIAKKNAKISSTSRAFS